MCGLRTRRLLLAALWTAGPALAQQADLPLFAACAGRYSATVEHLWLTGGPAVDAAERRRDAFGDLVAALAPDGRALSWQVAAKAAQRGLWDRAAFAGDLRAGRTAQDWLARCDSLLPGA